MIARLPSPGRAPQLPLERLIARHGARAVTLALIRALMITPRRKRQKMLNVADLSPHLRRDIGLPPTARGTRHWDHF